MDRSDPAIPAPRGNADSLNDWTPSSWTSKPIKQAPTYTDQAQVAQSLAKLETLPPIVTATEIEKLKTCLRDCAEGRAFLLQGGDCAELFDYCTPGMIDAKIKLVLQMSLVLVTGLDKKIVRILRMAGQYAKPRSSEMEKVNGTMVNSFRGDILNGYSLDQRTLDPGRLVE